MPPGRVCSTSKRCARPPAPDEFSRFSGTARQASAGTP
jgi:hypothetical protein